MARAASSRLRILEPAPEPLLKAKLEAVAAKYDRAYLDTDPLKFAHRYRDPRDAEVAGLIAAAFAYGSVVLIFRAVERLLGEMGDSPAAFLERWDARRDARRFHGFRHRFHGARDVTRLFSLLSRALRGHGSLGELFAAGWDEREANVGPALSRFVAAILDGPQPQTIRHLLSSPADGSACKRMLLWLRWMIRPADGVDLGLWTHRIPPSKLVIPLDTHTFRITRYLGLTNRSSPDWRAAEEVTARLTRLDPQDPVRYDFGLCRLGILDLCPSHRDPRKCRPCDLFQVCRL